MSRKSGKTQPSVLVIDDESDVLYSFQRFLSDENYAIVIAESAELRSRIAVADEDHLIGTLGFNRAHEAFSVHVHVRCSISHEKNVDSDAPARAP